MDGWYAQDAKGVSLKLAVRPKAGRTRTGPVVGDHLKIELKEPDQDGKANEALLRVLAKRLGVPKERVRIVAGRKNRRKTVRVDAVVQTELLERLQQGEPT